MAGEIHILSVPGEASMPGIGEAGKVVLSLLFLGLRLLKGSKAERQLQKY